MLAESYDNRLSVNLSRRTFLNRMKVGFAGLALPGLGLAADRITNNKSGATSPALVGSNIYGWGQYAQRDHKALDVQTVISALRDSGYDYLEANLDVARPEENGRFADQLKAKGLR